MAGAGTVGLADVPPQGVYRILVGNPPGSRYSVPPKFGIPYRSRTDGHDQLKLNGIGSSTANPGQGCPGRCRDPWCRRAACGERPGCRRSWLVSTLI